MTVSLNDGQFAAPKKPKNWHGNKPATGNMQ